MAVIVEGVDISSLVLSRGDSQSGSERSTAAYSGNDVQYLVSAVTLHPSELKPGGEVVRPLGGSRRMNKGEIRGPVSVSVASGKGGVLVLDPTDCAPSWRKRKAQSVCTGLTNDGDGMESDIITDLQSFSSLGQVETEGNQDWNEVVDYCFLLKLQNEHDG